MVSSMDLHLLQAGEVEEVSWAVSLMVKLHGIGQLQLIVHVG